MLYIETGRNDCIINITLGLKSKMMGWIYMHAYHNTNSNTTSTKYMLERHVYPSMLKQWWGIEW